MVQTFFSRLAWFAGLLLLQAFVFNNIHIGGYATPMPYVYFLMLLPSDTPRWLHVLLGFLLGLLIDIFSCTPGMAAASLCLTGLLAPLFLRLFASANYVEETFQPSVRTMEWGGFLRFGLSLSLINAAAFLCIEYFSFFHWKPLLISIAGSTVLSVLFVGVFELLRTSLGRPRRR